MIAVLRTLGRTSQADIARATGLSRTTVSTLVAGLRDAGLVFEVDAKVPDGRGGRPGVQLVLEDSSMAVVGIDVGHSHVQVAVADLAHDVLAERICNLEVRDHATDALDAAARMVGEVLVEARVQRAHVISAGIGAGLVIDGKLLRGASGTAGEIGHTTLDEAGALCYCGNRGCLETVASGPAILQLVGQGRSESLTLAQVIELAARGDVRCRRAISDAGTEIGVAVAGPERVIIGGLLSRAGELLLQPIRDSIRRHAVLAAAERVEVVPAVFVERAELLGSLALALSGWNPALASRA